MSVSTWHIQILGSTSCGFGLCDNRQPKFLVAGEGHCQSGKETDDANAKITEGDEVDRALAAVAAA